MRLVSVVVLLLCFFAGPSQAADQNVMISLLENNVNGVHIEYRFADFSQRHVRLGGTDYVQVSLGRESLIMQKGSPSLPDVSRSIVIPFDATVEVDVTTSRFYDLEGIDIIPSRGSILRSVNPATVPYTFGPVYTQDNFFPGKLAVCREPYTLRDLRGVVLTVNPFQYNPVQRLLRVYTTLTVKVTFHGNVSTFRANHVPSAKKIIRPFHEIYRQHFLNYSSPTRYNPLDENGELLIIAHDPWLSELTSFAAHKNARGIQTTVVGVSTIGNNATSIKSYIQSVYDSTTVDLAYVLLVGDSSQIASPNVSGGASDPSYAKLAGSDDYPEILVGRFSAETLAQLQTQVQRTIEYEQMPATSQSWFWKGVGVGSDQGPGDDNEMDWEHIENIRTDLLAHGYTSVDQIYDPGATAAQVTASLNAGRGFVNYCGHGGIDSWSTTGFDNGDIDNLTNDNKLPFIVTVACNNGEFNGYTCFGEAWLRATNGTEPTGAIGVYASSISQSWDEPMSAQDEIVDQYCAENYAALGTLFFAGSCLMMDEYGSDGVRIFNTWILFGDPSLQVVSLTGLKVSPATGFMANGPSGGPFSPATKTYTLINLDQQSLSFEIIKNANWFTISQMNGSIAAGQQQQIQVSFNSATNSLPNNNHQAQIQIINTSTHDGDTTRDVFLQVGVPAAIHNYNLDSNPGWSTSGEWQFGQPTGQGGTQHGHPDPTSGYTGTNVYGINLNGDYSTSIGGPYYLTSPALDCSMLFDAKLRYKRWLNADYAPYTTCKIEISTNGSSWTMLWQNSGSEISDNSWSTQEFDISEIADGESTVYLRWSHQVGSSAYSYSGWNIDDIEIWGILVDGATIPTLSFGGMVILVLLLSAFLVLRSRQLILTRRR